MKPVTIGGKEFSVERFKGLKAILVLAAMTRIAREIPDIMSDAVVRYQSRNHVIVTEEMSRLPRWAGFSKEDFDAAEAATNERVIKLPSPMSDQEQILASLPDLLEKARKEVSRLLAILIIPNDRLREADKAGNVEEILDEYQDVLMYDAELDELADLLFAAKDVLADQLSDRKERLGNMAGTLMKAWLRSRMSSSNSTSDIESPVPEILTPPTSSPDVPTSSTSSEPNTAGAESTPSTMSPTPS